MFSPILSSEFNCFPNISLRMNAATSQTLHTPTELLIHRLCPLPQAPAYLKVVFATVQLLKIRPSPVLNSFISFPSSVGSTPQYISCPFSYHFSPEPLNSLQTVFSASISCPYPVCFPYTRQLCTYVNMY